MVSQRIAPYKRVENSLRKRVREGEWVDGDALPGRRKLAEEYGVALSTIQRAISDLIHDGTLEADGNLGTFVAKKPHSKEAFTENTKNPLSGLSAAVSYTKNSSRPNIGIVIPHYRTEISGILNTFYDMIFAGIRDVFALENVYTSYIYRNERNYHEIQRESDCDGLIFITPSAYDIYNLRELYNENVNFISLLSNATGIVNDAGDLPSVDSDNRDGARQAIRHLIDLGHKQIATINLALCQTDFGDRLQGYLDELKTASLHIIPANMVVSSYPWNGTYIIETIEKWVAEMISKNSMPTAIFTSDFVTTLQTLAILQKNGVRVPEDVSLVGYDDMPIAEHTSPPLTQVSQPIYQIGYRGASRLIEHIKNGTGRLSECELLLTQLIVRKSTAPPRAEQ